MTQLTQGAMLRTTNPIKVTITMMIIVVRVEMFTTITVEVEIIVPKNLMMNMTDARPPATSNVKRTCKGTQAQFVT